MSCKKLKNPAVSQQPPQPQPQPQPLYIFGLDRFSDLLTRCGTTKDKDGDHTISVDEFTERCMQLHGPAKSADLYAIRQLTATRLEELNVTT